MKLVYSFLYVLLILLLLGVASLFLLSFLPIPNNIEVKIVRSGSMAPAIPTGAIVIVRPQSSYEIGDVITFGEDSKSAIPTTHRIVSVRNFQGSTLFTTKGDANEDVDAQEVLESSIAGKALVSIPYAGYILDFARQPLGFILLIAIPAAAIIIDELIKIVREFAHMRRNKLEQV